MITVLESIKLTTEYLDKKGIESPRINAELLLAKILGCKRLDLYLMFDRPLKQDETELYRSYLNRRSKNEPLQYIVGSVEFYGMEFNVNKNVLIPRQETEILVETVIESADKDIPLNILDIGTGSGNIAIVLAKHLPSAKITSVDCSKEAIETAKVNAEKNGMSDNIIFKLNDVINDPPPEEKYYDIIVSNPPYISSIQFETLQPELRIFEPKIALTDKADGYTFYKAITEKSKNMLRENGRIYFEVGEGQSKNVADILKENGFSTIKLVKDYLNIERVVTGNYMKALVQRVIEGGVYITSENYEREIGKGMVILLGIKTADNPEDVDFVADKCVRLRIFDDANGKMNLSLKDIDGEVLIISQFTLYAETRRGNRPSFTDAARPEEAIPLYEKFIQRITDEIGRDKVKTGIFGAMMKVKIINDGPVTITVESK